jgi:translation elongation factor P/translation initiation factor 5A
VFSEIEFCFENVTNKNALKFVFYFNKMKVKYNENTGENPFTTILNIMDLKLYQLICHNSRPHQILELKRTKVGKHGQGKTFLRIKDIFSNVLDEIVIPHSFKEVLIPVVEEKKFRVVGIWENFLDIVNEEEKPVASYQIPERFEKEIKQDFLNSLCNGENLFICIYTAMGIEIMKSYEIK